MNEPDALPGALADWLRRQGCRDGTLAALAGDVSLRRYFRVARGEGTAILAFYPAEIAETMRRFDVATRLLEAAGVPVPRILAQDERLGVMLVEDFGGRTLYDLALDWPRVAPYFAAAAEIVERLRGIDPVPVAALNPPLGASLLERELEKTREFFLEPRGLLAAAGDSAAWSQFAAELCARLAGGEPVPCHRDFMARNLVPLEGGGVAVLDHQDLRLGPPAYDLASLLNDSLFPPPEIEEPLLERAGFAAGAARLDYHRAAVQRGLKAVGTFAAFAQRGSTRHLPLVAPTGARALRNLAALPERDFLPAALRARLAEAFCYTD